MGRLLKHIAAAKPRTVLAIAWLWLFVYGFPGQMVADTFEHLIEARAGRYSDGSPPVFTLLFAISDAITGGQLLVFLVQTTAFVAGAFLTFRRLLPRNAHWWTLALCAFPPVFTMLPIVWKDSLLPALLLCGIGCILDERRWMRVLGLVAMLGATAIRYNAFAAAGPIVVLLFVWRPGLHWIKRGAIAIVAWVAVTFAAVGSNAVITDDETHVWYASLALFDIVGTLHHVDGTIPDSELAPLFANTGIRIDKDFHETIRKRYVSGNFFNLVVPPDPLFDVPIRGYDPPPPKQRDAIRNAWDTIVFGNKGAYLAHRWRVFSECLALKHRRHSYWAVPGRDWFSYPGTAQREGISLKASRLQHAITEAVDVAWHNSSLFEPSLYFIVSLLLLALARKHRDVLAILLSGIGIELTLFFLTSSADYRYSHWMVICTCVSIVALVSKRMKPAGRDDPALVAVTREDPVDAGAPRLEPK